MIKLLLISCISALSLVSMAQSYVTLENGKFRLNNADFYPITINYAVDIINGGNGNYWVHPDHRFGNGVNAPFNDANAYECQDKACALAEIKASFQLLKDLKVNSIRLLGFAVGECDTNGVMIRTVQPLDLSVGIKEELLPPYTSHFTLIKEVLDIAQIVGIKVVLLTGFGNAVTPPPSGPSKKVYMTPAVRYKYGEYLADLDSTFSNNPTIMAYDLYNEPGIGMPLPGTKTEICATVSGWISKMKDENNKHLITVGFTGSAEVVTGGGWDPELIPIDFASFHPYPSFNPYNISTVENEIYWYKNNISKPWIIGETGGSNLDGTPIDDQIELVTTTLQRVKNCNGVGYSWWQYSDLADGSNDLGDYGVVTNSGTTTTSTGLVAQGSIKPFAHEFTNFVNNYIPNYVCSCKPDYYNEKAYSKYLCTGNVKNINNIPIKDAIIYGWDSYWRCYTTRTDANGNYSLYSDTKVGVIKSGAKSTSVEQCNSGELVELTNKTVNLGETDIQITSNDIICNNYVVMGNGTTGGTAILNSMSRIIFGTGSSADKGANLTTDSKFLNFGITKLTPLSACNLLKSANINNDNKNISDNNELNADLKVFPNPSSGIINIELNFSEQITIELYDTYGNKLFTKNTSDHISVVDISSYPSGIYSLKIRSSKGFDNRKIIRL